MNRYIYLASSIDPDMVLTKKQAALLCEKNQKEVIHSVILVGTPHFKGGFAQWVGLCVGSKPTEESAPWKTCEKSVSKIVEMVQRKFRAAFVRDNSRIHVACCIAAKAGDTSKVSIPSKLPADDASLSLFPYSNRVVQAVSPDWCMLPGSWVLELPATYEQMTSFTSAVDYDEVYKMVQKWITEADIPRTPSAASSPPAAPELERVVRPQSQFYAYPPHRQDMLAVGSVVTTAEDMELLARPQDIQMALQPSSSNARLSARPPHHPTGRTSRPPAAPMRRCDSDASVHTLQGLSLTDSREGPGGIQARNNRGCMISQETAIQYARGASRVQKVREHIRATGRAYLVVGNGAAAAEGTGKEGEMEGVRLWEVKCTPSRRNSRESVASLVA